MGQTEIPFPCNINPRANGFGTWSPMNVWCHTPVCPVAGAPGSCCNVGWFALPCFDFPTVDPYPDGDRANKPFILPAEVYTMQKRANAVTFKGTPHSLVGPELKAGDKAPDFEVLSGLEIVKLA